MEAEYHDEMEEVAAAKDVKNAEVVDEGDEVEDAEYAVDVPDEGRNALFDLYSSLLQKGVISDNL